MTSEQLAEWLQNCTLSEYLEALERVPKGHVAIVAMAPKDGKFNRCSMCGAGITKFNAIGTTVTIKVRRRVLKCIVIVCCDECERRVREEEW